MILVAGRHLRGDIDCGSPNIGVQIVVVHVVVPAEVILHPTDAKGKHVRVRPIIGATYSGQYMSSKFSSLPLILAYEC